MNYHQFANDIQLYTVINPDSLYCLASLTSRANAVTGWHIRNDHLLNPSKTEALVAGTRQQVAKLDTSSEKAESGSIVPFSLKLRVLGVTLDEKLTFDDHISGIVQTGNYHLWALRHIRPLVDQDTANTIACLLVCTRLDYCNTILYGVKKQNIGRLQHVQHSLARIVCLAPYRSFNSRLRRHLHWLPVQERITFKITTLTHKVLTHHQPGYLSELSVEYWPVYNLCSEDKILLVIPWMKTKIASRAFRVSAPTIWNSLPLSLRCTTTISSFRSQLKTYVFGNAYGWSLTFERQTLTHCKVAIFILRRTLNDSAPQYKFYWLIDCWCHSFVKCRVWRNYRFR